MKKICFKKIMLITVILMICFASIATANINEPNYSETKTMKQLELLKPDNSYPVKIFNEDGKLVVETTMQKYLDNKEQIEREHCLGKYRKK